MKYYEIWFYYYGENDSRTDYNKEFTFYIKVNRKITSDADMLQVLKERMEKEKEYKNWLEGHLEHMSKWFEISASEFTDGCGIPA